MSITESIELLKAYNGPLGLTLHTGASEELIKKVESTCDVILPDDFKTFYRFTDGFETIEDIFNMIPLDEIGENHKKGDNELWIAEYMIYSDMWELEVNPKDPNDYAIFNVDGEKEKIILTKSLAEFIVRFLKGGVFETAGLYAWRDEVKAKLYGNTDPEKTKPLLAVFREGLKLGVISKEEIVQRADWIISTEDEPDYFFIEISLSHDVNELLTVLNSIDVPEDILHLRVILGVVHTQLLINKITTDKARVILDKMVYRSEFTRYEKIEMYFLTDDFDCLDRKLDDRTRQRLDQQVKHFLDNYAQFNLYNYKNWDSINADLIKTFESKKVEPDIPYQTPYKKIGGKVKRLVKKAQILLIWIATVAAVVAILYYTDPPAIFPVAIVIAVFFSRRYVGSVRK
ncbi:SMI1/KNR4 family protein [Mucilaginibacter sp. McL0603]|uniref:SMI1/KNR4 family protein n=1 Tax=Mucilaginibacter sp. McL0603 TaxID=3415670 RepID=UPI003CF56781